MEDHQKAQVMRVAKGKAMVVEQKRPSEGIALWHGVLRLWRHYRTWLRLAASFASRLVSEVRTAQSCAKLCKAVQSCAKKPSQG